MSLYHQGIILPAAVPQVWRAFERIESFLELRLCQFRDNVCGVYPVQVKGRNQAAKEELMRLASELSSPFQAAIYSLWDSCTGFAVYIYVVGSLDTRYDWLGEDRRWFDGDGRRPLRGPRRVIGVEGRLLSEPRPVIPVDEEDDDTERAAPQALALDETIYLETQNAFLWDERRWLAKKRTGAPAVCGPWSAALSQVFRAVLSSTPPEMLIIALDHPEDPNGWLIVADWLEERGQAWEAARCRDCSQMAEAVSQEAWLRKWRKTLSDS